MVWTLPLAAGLAAWFLAGRLRQYALARRMVDIPNPRSSHVRETPRGGGGAVVVVTAVIQAWYWWSGDPDALPVAVMAGGLLVAGVGFADDHRHLSPLVRLVCHFLAATLAVTGLGGTGLGVLADVAAVVYVGWLINLTNFMDGIDGIAGAQTLTVCVVGALLYVQASPGSGLWLEPTVLAAATAGFLVWNWPPARLFMGDVGSGYVGFMVAVFSLRAAAVAPELGWSWLILSGVFIVDATIALLRRAARRSRLFEAHRTHAYQHLALAWRSHQSVTLLIIGINVGWLTPIAVMVATSQISGVTGLVLGYVPLTIGAVRLGSGVVHQP